MNMRTITLTAAILAGSIALPAQADNEAMMTAAGEQVFAHKCSSCHSADPSKNAFGPSLVGVVGRKAASLPRFAYSDALKKSDITWSDETLRSWVAGNDEFVPGTRMRHVEVTDKAEQDYLISYLKSLK